MPSVDVFVPCYNYARFLPECVESVLGQAGVDVRVLILDDASPDDTPEVGRALAAADSRVTYRRHTTNRGHVATYNEGIEWATANYCLLLSADDVLTPGALARAATLMDHHPEVGFTFGRGVTTDRPDFRGHPMAPDYRYKILSTTDFWEASCAEASNIVSTPTAVIRTSVQKAAGGYRPELPHTCDLEMWMRLAARGPVGAIEADQGFYRVHGANMHVQMFPAILKVLDQHRAAFDALFLAPGPLVRDAGRLRRMASRGLALGVVRTATRLFERGERAESHHLARLAAQIFPDVRREREWRRLQYKYRIGQFGTRQIGRVLRIFRPAPAVARDPFGRSGAFAGL
jgi:hypothetical protein